MSARSGSFRNVMPGFGSPPDSAAPHDFDYNMWLGPAPERPYNKMRGLYHFRWFWDYSGGQMTNLGAHEIDIIQWIMRQKGPTAVSSSGGRFALQEAGETPDTQDALFEYHGFHGRLFVPRGERRAPCRWWWPGVLRNQGEPGD